MYNVDPWPGDGEWTDQSEVCHALWWESCPCITCQRVWVACLNCKPKRKYVYIVFSISCTVLHSVWQIWNQHIVQHKFVLCLLNFLLWGLVLVLHKWLWRCNSIRFAKNVKLREMNSTSAWRRWRSFFAWRKQLMRCPMRRRRRHLLRCRKNLRLQSRRMWSVSQQLMLLMRTIGMVKRRERKRWRRRNVRWILVPWSLSLRKPSLHLEGCLVTMRRWIHQPIARSIWSWAGEWRGLLPWRSCRTWPRCGLPVPRTVYGGCCSPRFILFWSFLSFCIRIRTSSWRSGCRTTRMMMLARHHANLPRPIRRSWAQGRCAWPWKTCWTLDFRSYLPAKEIRHDKGDFWAPLRRKIENIIRKGNGVADPDAPDDPESVLFWVHAKARLDDKSRLEASASLDMRGPASAAFVDDLMAPVSGTRPALSAHASGIPGTDAMLEASRQLQAGVLLVVF